MPETTIAAPVKPNVRVTFPAATKGALKTPRKTPREPEFVNLRAKTPTSETK